MTLVRGTTLAEPLAYGTLSDRRALEILAAVAEGLDAGAREGLVYRRLQPSGILLADDGAVLLGDFGAARWDAATELIGTGRLGHFADYVSPEELAGDQPTTASGVYSLGAIAFEALAGRPPFASEHEGPTLEAHVEAPPKGPGSVRPELPGRLDQAIARALSKDPALRQRTAGELMQSVIRAVPADADQATEAAPPTSGREAKPRRRRLALAALALVGVLGAGALGAAAASGGKEPAPAPVPAKRVSNADLTLRHPADWRVSRQAPGIPGLTLTDPVALSPPAVSRNGVELVAGSVGRGGLPQTGGELVDLGAVVARRYTDLREPGSSRKVVAYAVPSGDGQVLAACVGPAAGPAASRCRRAASTVRPRREGLGLAPPARPTRGR